MGGLPGLFRLRQDLNSSSMHKWAKSQYQQLVPMPWRVMFTHPQCDPQSTCCTASAELVKCINRDYARSQDREDAIMALLNHEKLLDRPLMYNTLALLTIHEAVQTVVQLDETTENPTLKKLRELEDRLMAAPYREPPRHQSQNMQLFYLKHIGDGIGYLKLQKQAASTTSTGWPSIEW